MTFPPFTFIASAQFTYTSVGLQAVGNFAKESLVHDLEELHRVAVHTSRLAVAPDPPESSLLQELEQDKSVSIRTRLGTGQVGVCQC